MAPFCNKGWSHFNKINEITPNANARSTGGFSAMNTTLPGQLQDDEAESGAVTSNNKNANNIMDIDNDKFTLISTASKCKLSSIYNDNDNTITSGSGPPTSSSINMPISKLTPKNSRGPSIKPLEESLCPLITPKPIHPISLQITAMGQELGGDCHHLSLSMICKAQSICLPTVFKPP